MKTIKTLADAMPKEFMGSCYENSASRKFANVRVVSEHMSFDRRWEGPLKNVHSWVLLENGIAVGWNENPATGWSFPCFRLVKKGT